MNALNIQPRLALGDRPSAGFAQLTNMALGLQTYLDCAEAGAGMPRIGLLYGHSGYGKSVAMAFTAQRTGAAYLEAKSIWTQRSLLEAIAEELGIPRLERSAPRILQQVIDQLNADPRGLIVDEMDYLVGKQHVEILRDIHDATTVPILLVGEEALPQKLKSWERFHNRILVTTPAQPASLDDALKLRAHYCPRVEIADDLVEAIVQACRGVTRRIVVNLKNAERLAMESAAAEIDAAWWGDRPFQTGDVMARRLAA
ncbi:MAG TPA: ATP-binding protein [Allosphingosinicella sp.]|nr:ATP-binding protein [Allosphingosinicella sp.]